MLGINCVDAPSKYLGLPTIVGRSKRRIFYCLKEKIRKKLKGWKEKLLAYAGREVLIKVVAQSISTYIMSVFKLPSSLISDIQSMIAKFWWGAKMDERKFHWLSLSKLCRPKDEGGLGFRHLELFNTALLAKQVWRLLHHQNLIAFQVLRAKYFADSTVLEAKVGYHPSFTWRSIANSIWVVKEGSRWKIGNGKSVLVWKDRWLLSPPSFRVITPKGINDEGLKVCDLFQQYGAGWDADKVNF